MHKTIIAALLAAGLIAAPMAALTQTATTKQPIAPAKK